MSSDKGFMAIVRGSLRQLTSRPIYFLSIIGFPIFCMLFLTGLMREGLPINAPAAIVDEDHSAMSRSLTQNLASMQLGEIVEAQESFTSARHAMQEGKIYGFFHIPENFEADLLADRHPVISYYYNMTYFVPGSLLFKTFKTTALYNKAGIIMEIGEDAGLTENEMVGLVQPVNIVARPIGNPGLNYAIYLCNSFIPACLQLMIMLVTAFSLGQLVKYKQSPKLLQMADGSVLKALTAWLLPQTLIWWAIVLLMESWLFKWNGYPMHGSWFWITLSELLFVPASQAVAVFIYGIFPNLRLSLSICSLTGVLTFSLGAFSFPVEAMYTGVRPFTWLMPSRYNFLIYIDQALNGIDIAYSKWWFVAYLVWLLIPLMVMPRIKKAMLKAVYVP